MESFDIVIDYFNTYGVILLFIIVYLEYLNLPGLPSGIIMPAAGVLVAQSDYSFTWILIVSVIAGLLGSLTLYYIGYFVGNKSLNWMYEKFPKSRTSIDKAIEYSDKYGDKGMFVSRLLPVIRTLISLTAGAFKVNIGKFILYSTPGIAIWNVVFILFGYVAMKLVM